MTLDRLLLAHPDLRSEAESIARSLLAATKFQDIAHDVEAAIRAFDMGDAIGRRAGRHEGGYVEPSQAAWDMLEEVVEPFLAELQRKRKLGLETEALEVLKGIVLGLYCVDHGRRSDRGEVMEWAPDFPGEAAVAAIEAWMGRGRGGRKAGSSGARSGRTTLPEDFVERFVPKWAELIQRASAGKR